MSDHKSHPKIVLFGQSIDLSINVFKEVINNYEVVGIVEFFKNAGAKRTSRLFDLAYNNNILYEKCEDEASQNKLIDFLHSTHFELGYICSMPYLLKEELLFLPKYGYINIHPSLLPDYKGPNPKFWIFYNLERESGCTIHYVDPSEDNGNILIQDRFEIPRGLSFRDYDKLMINAVKKIAIQAIELLFNNYKGFKQVSSKKKRARRLKPEDDFAGVLEWSIQDLFHFLGGTNSIYRIFKIPKLLTKFLDFEVCGYKEHLTNEYKERNIHLNSHGFFFKARNGSIRLNARFKKII